MADVEVDGRVAATWREAAASLLESFFGPETVDEVMRTYDDDSVDGPEILSDDIEKCLKRLKNRKAPGVDGFTSQIVKQFMALSQLTS